MTNSNWWVITTDWHVTKDDVTTGGLGETFPSQCKMMSQYINSLAPAGVVDLGDCGDHYTGDKATELDNYVAYVKNVMRWPSVSGGNATHPCLPGNHDKLTDYTDAEGADPYSLFNARLWSSPYHWYTDWSAPKIRFIAIHTNILHSPHASAGGFSITQAEIDWLETQLAALPVGWKAIVCSHAPLDNAFFGNGIILTEGGTALLALIAANSAKIAACLGGHRHINGLSNTLSGVLHISCPAMSYTENNSPGGFFLLEYDGADTITAHYRTGPGSLLGAMGAAVYTPILISV